MYSLLRSLLFQIDAEAAHELVTHQMMRLQSIPVALGFIEKRYAVETPSLRRTLLGLEFRNPLGIAAGFDKNAQFVPFLQALGFGFVEVGTVTLHPQGGNPKPRLFRDPSRRALINRLGFNNDGAAVVAQRLWNIVEQRETSVEHSTPIFVNIGKNRDVPIEGAPKAYRLCYELVAPSADVIVVNVSSPNTPGLRDLQRPEQLVAILESLKECSLCRPLLVKIAPDLTVEQIREIADVCVKLADGMVATNTTATPGGGLSGAPLFEKSTEVLRTLRSFVGEAFPLIGVGGIFNADDARAKLEAGADLVQAYTGFVYEGPAFARRITRDLMETSR